MSWSDQVSGHIADLVAHRSIKWFPTNNDYEATALHQEENKQLKFSLIISLPSRLIVFETKS